MRLNDQEHRIRVRGKRRKVNMYAETLANRVTQTHEVETVMARQKLEIRNIRSVSRPTFVRDTTDLRRTVLLGCLRTKMQTSLIVLQEKVNKLKKPAK